MKKCLKFTDNFVIQIKNFCLLMKKKKILFIIYFFYNEYVRVLFGRSAVVAQPTNHNTQGSSPGILQIIFRH